MRSNAYTLTFTTLVTVILGLLVSVAATSLKDRQQLNVEIDMKRNILQSLHIPEDHSIKLSEEEILKSFKSMIKEVHINASGEEDPNGELTIYEKIMDGRIEGYAFPISGKGLWSTIYGYLAMKPDGKTVLGITFYKHGETPGLGGEIEKEWFTSNFIGKQIVDENDQLTSIQIIKGKVDPTRKDAIHQVDGISGATMTGRGVTAFLAQDLKTYDPFFRKIRKGQQP
ncbi:MAG: NADH:ubiquinone reductase (Na(+)-transporting) subunit C [FCB group bacterium]|nr:NADH:ubiquinone reductase (Na(+)-transporting) subunit C [FCB group bacterium]